MFPINYTLRWFHSKRIPSSSPAPSRSPHVRCFTHSCFSASLSCSILPSCRSSSIQTHLSALCEAQGLPTALHWQDPWKDQRVAPNQPWPKRQPRRRSFPESYRGAPATAPSAKVCLSWLTTSEHCWRWLKCSLRER